jgi:hypothetical protein
MPFGPPVSAAEDPEQPRAPGWLAVEIVRLAMPLLLPGGLGTESGQLTT